MQYEDSIMSITLYVMMMYNVFLALHKWLIVVRISRCKNKAKFASSTHYFGSPN